MQIDEPGKTFIKTKEGLSFKAYVDAEGYSVGYGHFIKPDEQYLMQGVTQAKADELFDADIAGFDAFVRSKVTDVTISQNEHNALVAFTYNVGKGAFAKSTLLKKVNAGDRAGAACEFMKWIYSTRGGVKYVVPALRTRRKAEQVLYYGSEPVCAGLIDPPEAPAAIVKDDKPSRENAPVRGGGYAQNKLPDPVLKELDEADAVLQATGKLPVKKGYKVQRRGDSNAGQGVITTTVQSTVFVNGKPVSVNGSVVLGPAPRHPSVTANGSKKVFAEGKPVNFETNPDANQLPRIKGSDDTFSR